MYFFIGLDLFRPDTWKTRFGTMWHILAPDIPAAGHFHLHVQEYSKCYRPNVRKVTPGSYALHHLVNHTFQQTTTHILGPHASFGGIPVLRRSFPPSPRKRRSMCPGGSTPLDFSTRGSTNVLFHRFMFV